MDMKKILFAVASMLLVFAACTKPENNNGTDPNGNGNGNGNGNTPIVLTASTTTPVMDKEHQDETALTLNWNATTNMGTGARVEYAVLIDRKGGSFESAHEIPLGPNVTTFSCTARELSEMAKEHFGLQNEETAELDICIYATIKSTEVDDVISNKVTITVKAFEPKPSVLYLIGSATEGGWDQSKAPEMSPIDGEDGGFTWAGELFAGELKFLVTRDSWVPSYGPGETEGTLSYRDHLWEDENGNRVDDESQPHVDTPDPKFIIAEQGNYKIVLNIEKLTITITKTGGPKYFSMFTLGTALDAPCEMLRSGYAFLAGVTFKEGKFHFNEKADGSGDSYFAAAEGQSLDKTAVSQTSGAEWTVSGANAKLHHLILFARENKEKAFIMPFTPYGEMWMIGSATDAGWDIANAIPMTKKSEWVQSWEGNLKAGELKFTCDRSTDWFGAWYLASTVNKEPTGEAEPMVFIDKASDAVAATGIKELDQKWIITDQTAGYYSITLDQQSETVIIKRK